MNKAGYQKSIITYVGSPATVPSYNLSAYKLMYVPSDFGNTAGGISETMNMALIGIKDKIMDFVNIRGE